MRNYRKGLPSKFYDKRDILRGAYRLPNSVRRVWRPTPEAPRVHGTAPGRPGSGLRQNAGARHAPRRSDHARPQAGVGDCAVILLSERPVNESGLLAATTVGAVVPVQVQPLGMNTPR